MLSIENTLEEIKEMYSKVEDLRCKVSEKSREIKKTTLEYIHTDHPGWLQNAVESSIEENMDNGSDCIEVAVDSKKRTLSIRIQEWPESLAEARAKFMMPVKHYEITFEELNQFIRNQNEC